MGEIVKRSRNIFIDTEQYHSNGDLVRLFFPNEAFALNKDESMKFVLSSFEMQKKFYNVNAYSQLQDITLKGVERENLGAGAGAVAREMRAVRELKGAIMLGNNSDQKLDA